MRVEPLLADGTPAANAGQSQPTQARAQRATEHVDYSPYFVSAQSIRSMRSACDYVAPILEREERHFSDKYKRFDALYEAGYQKLVQAQELMSSLVSLVGMGEISVENLVLRDEESDTDKKKTILEFIMNAVKVGGNSLSALNVAGLALCGGNAAIKALKWAMPYMKKSSLVAKINNSVWEAQEQYMMRSPLEQYIATYMWQRYELQYRGNWETDGMQQQYEGFVYLHRCRETLETDKEKRALEKAAFGVEYLMHERMYICEESEERCIALAHGTRLNLFRAGLAESPDITPEKAKLVTDILQDCYMLDRGVRPNLKVNPEERNVVWKE